MSHPAKANPVLVGWSTVNSWSKVAEVGWFVPGVPPLRTYLILYVCAFHFAPRRRSVLTRVFALTFVQAGNLSLIRGLPRLSVTYAVSLTYHPLNWYPFLFGLLVPSLAPEAYSFCVVVIVAWVLQVLLEGSNVTINSIGCIEFILVSFTCITSISTSTRN